jgi:hypothetical protein
MEGTLLEVNYNLNEGRTKRLSVGFDTTDGFKPFIYLYKAGAFRIKLDMNDWKSLVSIQSEVEDFFKRESFQPATLCLSGSLSVTCVESYGKRLIKFEYIVWPAVTTNRPLPVTKLWLAENHFKMLMKARPCLEMIYNHYMTCTEELETIYNTLVGLLKIKCGIQEWHHGIVEMVTTAIQDMDLESFMYPSLQGLDVKRAVYEMCTFNVEQLAHSLTV